MHFYICPYCNPDKNSRLIFKKEMNTACDHKKTGIFKNKDGECKEDKYKCKEVMHCKKCKSQFKPNEEFLITQKRKIKDGWSINYNNNDYCSILFLENMAL